VKLLNTVMENVLNDCCGVTSWHNAVSHVSTDDFSALSGSCIIVLMMSKGYL
jgi:hypothetical protein